MAREKVFTLCTVSMLLPATAWAEQENDAPPAVAWTLFDETPTFRQPESEDNVFHSNDFNQNNDIMTHHDFANEHASAAFRQPEDDLFNDFNQNDDAVMTLNAFADEPMTFRQPEHDPLSSFATNNAHLDDAAPQAVPLAAAQAPTIVAHQTSHTTPLVQPETDFDITQSQQRKIQQQNETIAPPTEPTNERKLQISKDELLQQPELLYRALSSSVLLRNVEGVRTLLPVYQKLPQNRDELLIKLSQAMIARADGEAGQAADFYQQALDIQPNMPLIRLNLAQSLYEDHQNREATALFEQIQAEPDLPKNVKELTDSYLKVLKKRRKWHAYAGANYTRDNNVNNAPKERVLKTRNGGWHLPEPQSAQGFAYRAGVGKDTPIYQNYVFRTNADLWGKFYWDNHDFDDLNVRASAGVAFQNARNEAAVLPYYDRRWYGGEKYSAEKGVRAEYSRWLTQKNQVLLAGEVGREVYDKRKFLDGRTANLSATLLHIPSKNNYFTVGADISRKSAQDNSDAYRRKAIRASWSQNWGKTGFNTVLTANYGQREYDARDFFNIVRKDKEYVATLSVWHKKVQLWGITPRIVGVYMRNDSNHILYDYRKAYAFIQLSKSI